ncbi:MAG: alanine racemase [Balneolia bacterium]|nr:alanine racemase [Balneolia bacterium]
MKFTEISTPTLLLNSEIARHNIARMANKCRKHDVGFNPHFKTHQSAEVGAWFREAGVDRITVSSIAMAEFFADKGWENITLAFPVNVRETERLNRLAQRVKLTLDVISAKAAITLTEKLEHHVHIMVEVDAGYGRTGVPASEHSRIDNILDVAKSSEKLSFYGFYIHAGHTYDVRGKAEVEKIHRQTLDALHSLKETYLGRFPALRISMGDTPSCSMLDNFEGIDEIRPGNFVFYDVTQYEIGSCRYNDIAVALAAPVVSAEPSRREIVVHGGAIHLSKDSIKHDDTVHYGLIARLPDEGWSAPMDGCRVRKVSQEHGIITLSEEAFSQIGVGDLVAILPVHSCLTADCMGGYLTEQGDYIRMLNWRS